MSLDWSTKIEKIVDPLLSQLIHLKKEVSEKHSEIVQLRARNQELEIGINEYSKVMNQTMRGYKEKIAELEAQLQDPSRTQANQPKNAPQALEVNRTEVWFGHEVPVDIAPLSELGEDVDILTEDEFKKWLEEHKEFAIQKMTYYV